MIQKKEDEIVHGWESPAAIHPGEYLKDILEECSISQIELAQRMGISKKIVNDIIKGKNPITQATAYKLSKVFDLSVDYWANLQNIYDSDRARLEEKKKIEKEVKEYLPSVQETYRELAKFKLVNNLRWTENNFAYIMLELQKYFGIDSLGFLKEFVLKAAFRKYDGKNINQYSLAAWLRLGQIEAYKTEVAVFDKQKLQNSLEEIKELSTKTPEVYLPKIKEILAEAGVAIVYAPYFKNTYAQGATEWIGKDKAYIILKTTKQGEDKFWFNLFHEIGHILKHSKKEIFVDIEDANNNRQIEEEADEFAEERLIPNFDKIAHEYTNLEAAIASIAKEQKISPSIVAGRFAHECKDNPEAWRVTNGFIGRIDYNGLTISQ